MLTWGEAVEVHALRERGWSIAAIARHLDRDPKTIRAYVNGEREPGRRRRQTPDPLAPYVGYLAARFVDDPHIWASALYDEVSRLGYRLSYVSFARQLRTHKLRPHCQACSGVRGQPTIQIDHPPGAELQWDWFERRRAPWGGTAYVLLGSLPHSGRVRGVLAEATDQPHLVEAIDGVLPLRRHGAGLADRSAGHGRGARDRGRAAKLRPGGQALRRHGPAVPAPAGQPQGLGRGGGAVCVRPLVADDDRGNDHPGASISGPLLRHGRQRPTRPPSSSLAGWAPMRPSPSAATATRSRRGLSGPS